MKPRVLLIVICLLSISGQLLGQDTAAIVPPLLPPHSGHEINREKIQIEDLPQGVKESLRSDAYVSWSVESAYKAMMTDPKSPESEGLPIYLVEVSNDGKRLFLRFDQDGQLLDDPER